MPYQEQGQAMDASIRIRKSTKVRLVDAIYNRDRLAPGEYTWDEVMNAFIEKLEQGKIQD